MALNKVSDILSPADWLSQTHEKLSPVEIPFLSVVEIPVKHSSLYNINRLLHRKCAIRIFIHESQDFRNERVSVANE